ncbi:MAG TPA: metallophosphoesterase [Myxococcota bacterium]|nr:metallophosphoesterase [Myxococcota bacterium]
MNPRRLFCFSLLPPLLLVLWAFCLEPASLRVRTSRLALPGWPAACDGLRVAVLSDLHVGSPFNGLAHLSRVVARTGRARPDLILLAGDFLISDVKGGTFVAPEPIAEGLSKLSAPLGTFAVLGNHDWWFDGPRMQRALEHAGIHVLEDRSLPLARGECRFSLAGVGDFREAAHDVPRALAAVPADSAVIVFTHNPDVFPQIPQRVTLTIAGHTHGGQVYIPGIGRPIVPSRYGERYAIGHVVEHGSHLFVTSGIGTSLLPVRFLVPPEIRVLELASAN